MEKVKRERVRGDPEERHRRWYVLWDGQEIAFEIGEDERQEKAKLEAESVVLLTEQAGFLEAEDGYETQKFKQRDIRKAVDDQSSKNVFDLKLEKNGPYKVAYTRNGRHMLLCGERGHTAVLDCHTFRMSGELQLIICRDACF